MQMKPLAAALCAGFLWAGSASADTTTITFDDLAAGTTLANQYAAQGVTFVANAFSGAGTSLSGMNWATNTNMSVVSIDGPNADIGSLGAGSLASGNILRSQSGWLNENGDASFAAVFSTPITNLSVDFVGVGIAQDVRLFIYTGQSPVPVEIFGSAPTSQFTLSYTGANITRVVFAPGSYLDWVGVDNITFTTAVPEPESYALMALGLGVLAIARRRMKAADQA